ncbi:hypothetical protein NC239_34610 [Streptomyces sp. G3]|uniref:hypothetical protein n=1 Tax=Streptomyces sp. G3 TaxID=690144 RepID=UPI00202DED8F|nr:hypothetical protein [Streptomyces sp. G3]MCM1943331.1 hypothetical protein [Streptomyces sp. G3]
MVVTFAAAVLVASGVFYGLVYLLDFQEIDSKAKLDAATLFDLVKLSFGVVAGAGALVALVVAYRRQRVDEAGAHREATRLHTERLSVAVDKLGSDSPAVRLGGVRALAGLADDAPDDSLRQTGIDVLCAYLQLPFTPDPGDDPAHQEEHHRCLALRKVRHTILRLIGDHYRRLKGARRSWQGCDLDLTGVTIDGVLDFGGTVFSDGSVSFDGTVFSGGGMSFRDAAFSGSVVSFDNATGSAPDGLLAAVGSPFCIGHSCRPLADLESIAPRRRNRWPAPPRSRTSSTVRPSNDALIRTGNRERPAGLMEPCPGRSIEGAATIRSGGAHGDCARARTGGSGRVHDQECRLGVA